MRHVPARTAVCCFLLGAFLTACTETQAPVGPETPTVDPALASVALKVHVDMVAKKAVVVQPQGTNAQSSLMGSDIVQVSLANMTSSDLPGQRALVRFDVAITNSIPGTTLLTPTFPAPPAGASGVLLFPFDYTIVGRGNVAASTDWDGAPHNFFNDKHCNSGVSVDCFRYEAFTGELDGGQTTSARSVGFEVDKSVTSFTVMMVVAADMKPTPYGAISGTVTSDERGALHGTVVQVVPAGQQATTDNAGTFAFAKVRAGTQTLHVTGLPSYCQPVAPQTITVTNGGTTNVTFDAECLPLTGTVMGSVRNFILGALGGVTVSAGGVSTQTDEHGGYTLRNVPAGMRDVTVTNLPPECIAPLPQPTLVIADQLSFASFPNVGCDVPSGSLHVTVRFVGQPAVRIGITVNHRQELTRGDGTVLIEFLRVGTATVTPGVVPNGCVRPPARTVEIIANTTQSIEFVVECAPPTGFLTGAVMSDESFPRRFSGVVVRTSNGQTTVTDAVGGYNFPNAPVGPTTITVDSFGTCTGQSITANVLQDQLVVAHFRLSCR